ncbi:hypothetical protein [Celeribacter arenosi]|uniref:Uncharacterized protein n=1 Tax=Celeribacter arenosi TaxID=792649 RepID=A0ABP7JXA0_9RHOB
MKRDTLTLVLVGLFIVGPAILALSAYMVTQNPALRPLGITFEKLVEAGQISDKSMILAVIDIGTDAPGKASETDYVDALQSAFSRYDVEAQVRFRTVPGGRDVFVTYLVGQSRIGPYPVSRAAEGIRPAAEAERMLVAQRTAVAREAARRAALEPSFWDRIFN